MAPRAPSKKAVKNAVGLRQRPPMKAKAIAKQKLKRGFNMVLLDEDHVNKYHVHKKSFLRKVPQLSKDLKERNEVTIRLDQKIVPKLIDYIYTNEMDYNDCSSYDLNALVMFAIDYGLDSLADEVERKIVDEIISVNNCCRFMNQTCISKRPRIHDACYQMLVGKFAEIAEEELCFLPAQYLEKVLHDLAIDNEEQAQIIVKWRKIRAAIFG